MGKKAAPEAPVEASTEEQAVTESLRDQTMQEQKTTAFIGGDEMEAFAPSSPQDRGDEVKALEDELAEKMEEATKPEEPSDEEVVTESLETKDEVTEVEEPPPPKEQKIPKSRFDKVNERYKAAKAALEAREAQDAAKEQAVEGTYDFDAKEQEYLELVLDGKTAEAAQIRKEIRAAERASIEAEIDSRAQNTVQKTTVADTLQKMSDEYSKDFPGFNPEAEAYDSDAIEEVKALYSGYVQQSGDPVVAFEKAVEAVIKLREWNKVQEDEAPTPVVRNKPTAEQVTKKVQMASKQPPSIADKGTGAPKLNDGKVSVPEMSESEFDALPAATKARLRGDYV